MQILLLSVVKFVSSIFKSVFAVIYTITAVKWCRHQLKRVSVKERRNRERRKEKIFAESGVFGKFIHMEGSSQQFGYTALILEER